MIVDGFLQWSDTQYSNHTPKQTLLLREVGQQKLDLIGLQKQSYKRMKKMELGRQGGGRGVGGKL